MSLFQNKSNLIPANQKNRSRANMFDGTILVVIILFLINAEGLNMALKLAIITAYIFLVLPLQLMLGGTIGHIATGLRVRCLNDYSKNISFAQAFKRVLFLVLKKLVGSKKNKDKFETESNSQTVELSDKLPSEEIKKYIHKVGIRRFAIYGSLYLAWVIWLGNYWFLAGILVVFDLYVSKKVNWSPWKKKNGPNNIIVEWFDAILFAVVAVTVINIFLFQNYKIPTGSMEKSLRIGDHLYVSKVAYGPRIPLTPLSLPFMQHSLPGSTKKSYIELIKWDYKRLKGFNKVKRWDPVVFNFPAGDTVCLNEQNRSYDAIVRDVVYALIRQDTMAKRPLKPLAYYQAEGRKIIRNEREIVVRPLDKKDNYIKRCVGVPGDSLQIKNGVLYVNGEVEKYLPGRQLRYIVQNNGTYVSKKRLKKMGVYEDEIQFLNNLQVINLSEESVKKIKKYSNVKSITPFIGAPTIDQYNIFPHNNHRNWTIDNFGPIYIPKAGTTVNLDMDALPFYSRIIQTYEGNILKVVDSTIYLNGEIANSYTFKMDYYWMMGDNRQGSLDSRYWGYVPEDHIIGKPKFVWLATNKEGRFPFNIQFSRMFKPIK